MLGEESDEIELSAPWMMSRILQMLVVCGLIAAAILAYVLVG